MASKNLQIVITGDAKSAQAALRRLNGDLGKTDAHVGRASRSMDGAFSRIGSMAGAAAAGVAAGGALIAGAAATWGISVASANEQAATSFEVLLGSAEEAQGFLGEMRDFAANTPFELTDLNDYAARLIAVGTEAQDVEPIMTNLGNAAAGMGKGAEGIDRAVTALGQMRQSGRVALEEINQLTEAGIPIIDALADKYGVAGAEVRQMATDGKIAVQDVFDVIENGSGPAFEKFAGMMEAQSKTLTGVLSNLKDTMGQALATTMQPALDAIAGSLPDLAEDAGNLAQSFTPLVDAASDFIPLAADLASGLAEKFAPAIERAGEFVQDLAEDALPRLAPVIVAATENFGEMSDAAIEVMDAATPLIPVVADLTAVTIRLGSESSNSAGMLQTLADVINIANWGVKYTTGTGNMADAGADLADNARGLKDDLGGAVQAIQDAAREAGDADGSFDSFASRMEGYAARITSVDGRISDVTKELSDAKKALDDALDDPMGGRFDEMTAPLQAQLGVMGEMGTAVETFRENAADGLTFDANSAEGRENLNTLLSYADAIWGNADALIEQTGNTEDAENATRLYSDQLSDMLAEMGVAPEEIERLLGEVGLVPGDFESAFDAAQTAIDKATGQVMILTSKLREARGELYMLEREQLGREGGQAQAYYENGTDVTYGAGSPHESILGYGQSSTTLNPPSFFRTGVKPMSATKGTTINATFHNVTPKQGFAELAYQARREW